ncbi:MAG: hypothetical protein PHE70_09355 [Tepidanaerobacteraceae bacterium]|nr:hypothetical protein [Tepidanaerobacteraceae bacterium]
MRGEMPEFIVENIFTSFLNFVIIYFVFKFTMSVFLAYKVYSQEKRVVSQKNKTDVNHNNNTSIEDDKGHNLDVIHDNVCDTFVLKEDAYIAVIGEERHYFCSWECRQKYLDNIKKNQSQKNRQKFENMV